MRDIAVTVQRWRRAGGQAMVARVVGGQGLGAWPPGGALLVADSGETTGALLGGTVSEPIVNAATAAMAEGRSTARLSVRVGEEEAVAAGLACAGEARIALESIGSLPEVLWSDLSANRPVALVVLTEEGSASGGTLVVRADGTVAGSLGDAVADRTAQGVASEMLRRPKPDLRVIPVSDSIAAVEVYGAFPHVVVVGGGDLASALEALCATLGWPCVAVDGLAAATAQLRELGSAGALVVLTHDPEVDAAVLRVALESGAGYVGALGSRHTQRLRAERLERLGVDEASRSAIFGPIGLDLGARNPPETALAICAEILGAATGTVTGSLRDTDRPIHR